MKKLSLLMAVLMVLVSGIVFSGCNDGYKKLKIKCNKDQIELVLDVEDLSTEELIFELSGAKKWGEIKIDSKPTGLVRSGYIIDGKTCYVTIKALQPSSDGASLEIVHLGSGKKLAVPLKIGVRLNTVASVNKDFIIQPPSEGVVREIEIPTKKLLNCQPESYSDDIVWQTTTAGDLPHGLKLISYDVNGEEVESFSVEGDVDGYKIDGFSRAVRTVLQVDDTCANNTTISISPISVLDGKAVLHSDVVVDVCVVDLLDAEEVKPVSSTHHKHDSEELGDLVLISNPDKNQKRPDSSDSYDYYSTALIDFKLQLEDDFVDFADVNPKYLDLYSIELSSNITNLLLENMDFGKIRAIATSTCVGEGDIVVKFVPNDCVGDINEFELKIPCIVGERATSFVATRESRAISIAKESESIYKAEAPLNDDISSGQMFKFDMLSVNTLSALKGYRISINQNLLNINQKYVDSVTNTSPYIANGYDGTAFDLTEVLNNKCEYQIAILKDGREMFFADDGQGNFVSEGLTSKNNIYMKWVKTSGSLPISKNEFGIKVFNFYNSQGYNYDIENNYFDETSITLELTFDRQRTVESVRYSPVKVTNNDGSWQISKDSAEKGWQFYFKPEMFDDDATELYGIYISEVMGINSTVLTEAELRNINLEIAIEGSNVGLGLGLFNEDEIVYGNPLPNMFNFDSDDTNLYANIVVIGKIADINFQECKLTISQNERALAGAETVINLYKDLTAEDILVSIPDADFDGEFLRYEKLVEQPDDWTTNWTSYYQYAGGSYVRVTNQTAPQFNDKAYYALVEGIEDLINTDNSYILAISKQYNVNIEIKNSNFVNISKEDVEVSIVSPSAEKLPEGYINNLCGEEKGKRVINTNSSGSFNTMANERNYIKITYKFTPIAYNYYKQHGYGEVVSKDIYLYVYEPLTSARFDHSMIYKYDISDIPNNSFKREYGEQDLTIEMNSDTVINYVDIQWKRTGDAIYDFELLSKNSANYTFGTLKSGVTAQSNIVAVLTQFGIQYPIYCGYVVENPILTETIELNNKVNNFVSGLSYINLKVGERLTIDATAKSSKGKVSFPYFSYVICSMSGYAIDSVASVDRDGNILALNAGRAKLLIIASDRIKGSLAGITDYFNTTQYIEDEAYIMVDIVVSDGSREHPYLIADSSDFMDIANDYYFYQPSGTVINDKHYALVADIDLGGQTISLDAFKGTISSFQEIEGGNNRFSIYGIVLTQENTTLFKRIQLRNDELANLQDIDFHVDINYKATKVNKDGNVTIATLIGLVGENSGLIKDVTVTISGEVDANNIENKYIIGSLVAQNINSVVASNNKLTIVQGQLTVTNSVKAAVLLGGVIGQNEGWLTGVSREPSIDNGQVEYEVYYDNQGAMADVELQVKGVDPSQLDNSAIGGVIGYNNLGLVNNVYSMGKVLGMDDAKALVVNNVGGLIGRNRHDAVLDVTVTTQQVNDVESVKSIVYNASSEFQINNSYSSAIVYGNNNVGGAVGFDDRGSYQKVYYEIYSPIQSIVGNTNVGGLIGFAQDSNLYYCYANSFAWDYQNTVSVYNIIGNKTVGGLIGLAQSSRMSSFVKGGTDAHYAAMNVVSSLASISIDCAVEVGGLIGRINNYGGIYTAYYYGVVSRPEFTSEIAKIYTGNEVKENVPFNNAYAIINGEEHFLTDPKLYQGTGFETDSEHNNGKPYIVYGDTGVNLVSVIPTVIQINTAFTDYYNQDNMLYKANKFGDYVKLADGSIAIYDASAHNGFTRYSLMAGLVSTGDTSGTDSDYRQHALVLYYYQFKDMSGEYALSDLYQLNTVDMHDIISDQGIIVMPNTFKQFSLTSSNNNIVGVLSGGRLLLRSEGQAVVTLTSTLNPAATASFVVIVRSKVLQFNLYSSANLREEYIIKDSTINIVKDSSKLIYADYSSVVQIYNRTYAYEQATNMEIDFTISLSSGTLEDGKNISDYIVLNGVYDEVNDVYTIAYGTPITITVKEHLDGLFEITANPYATAIYTNGNYSYKVRDALSDYFEISFNVATRKGASAVNVDKTQIEMMPADEPTNLDVKITTDVKVNELRFEIMPIGDFVSVPEQEIHCTDMLAIMYENDILTLSRTGESDIATGLFDLSEMPFTNGINLQQLTLSVQLNSNSYYVDVPFRLQVKIFVLNGTREISTILHINVNPQEISSIIPLNYRMDEGAQGLDLSKAYLSQVIRPGSSNIITIDIAPNIAVYEYVEIADLTIQDKILFRQVKPDLTSIENMDMMVEGGIRLQKYNSTTSKFYIDAQLPRLATANITHTLKITAYDETGNELYYTYLNLEAIMYPTVVVTYTYPNGISVVADTRLGDTNQTVTKDANLAVGVDAMLNVETNHIDANSLKGEVTIKNGHVAQENDGLVRLDYAYNTYILRFDANRKDEWHTLVGRTIDVTFTASKKLNAITETCSATISFSIKRMVIHGISMTHTTSKGELYGDWDESFESQFYFDKQDISYYDNGYWNIEYNLKNTNIVGNRDLTAINNILLALNKWESTGVNLYLGGRNEIDVANMTALTEDYSQDGISILNLNNKFQFKANEGSNINNLKFRVEFKVMYNAQGYPILTSSDGIAALSTEFGFNVLPKSSQFEEYETVSNQAEFEAMLEGRYYQLTQDMTFTNYTPISTAIGGLSGNGKCITIESFNVAQLAQNYSSGPVYAGLFGTVDSNCFIENVQVNYDSPRYDSVRLDFDGYASTAMQNINNIYFGGIAGQNLGMIINVNVLGSVELIASSISADKILVGGIASQNGSNESELLATITNSSSCIDISAMAIIGGVSESNYGKIANTAFEGHIKSKNHNTYTPSIATAGFVVHNMRNAQITLSYTYSTLSGEYDINTVGNAAGFVYENTGAISNCYISNTNIWSQGNIGGFVYYNAGEIKRSYSYAQFEDARDYEKFIYTTNNPGDIEECYSISDDNKINLVAGLTKINPSNIAVKEYYIGFIFASNDYGLWTITDKGPVLTNAGFDDNALGYGDIYNIYDDVTFEKRFDTRIGVNVIEGKTYRIVRDVDLGLLQTNPVTHSKILMANIEGNGMAIKNYNIFNANILDSIGLFASIGSNVYVRNLILQPTSVKASGSHAVGALAGEIDGALIYNINIDNNQLLILGKNAVGGLAGIIKGDFEIIGIESNVSAFAAYTHNIGKQYNLYVGKNVTNNIVGNVKVVSYAGSIAGVVDGYNSRPADMYQRDLDNYYTISQITLKGDLVIIGETVGAAFGMVGERTLVSNVNYALPSGSRYQGVYVSGGLIGENRGIVDGVKIYSDQDVDTKECFNNYARVNGAIVGLNIGGLVKNSESDIYIHSDTDISTVGGIVGRNIEGSIYNCTTSSRLSGYFVGGVVGTDYSYSSITKLQTEYGSATQETKSVYINVKLGVQYVDHDFGADQRFNNNILTYKFITGYLATKANYYNFNSSYIDSPGVENVVSATAVYGLVLGLTDSEYGVSISCKDGTSNYSNADQLIVSLEQDLEPERLNYKVPYGEEEEYIVSALANIVAPNLDLNSTESAILINIIAYTQSAYEGWSSSLGYTDDYIVISKHSVEVVE